MSYNYIVDNGVIVPNTSSIKTEVEAEWRLIAGEDATIDPSSFEGRLIDATTTERIKVARNNATLANQLNPNMANGSFVDAHLALVGGERDGEEQSTVELTLTGIVGTNILAGSYVEDINKQLWFLVSDTVIGAGNTVTASFRSLNYGEIPAAIGEITKIISGVVGWETVNNAAAATLGKIEQSDVSAKRQRRLELGANTRSVAESVISAVYRLEGVNGIQFRENYTNATAIIDGITLIAKSSWLCVDGGVTSEIAEAYYINRWGTDFNGAVEYVYTDPISGQTPTVKFDRATDVPIECRIEARVSNSQNAIADIKAAIVSYAIGDLEGEDGFSLGLDASPFEVASAVNAQLQNVFVKKCELALLGGTLSTDTIINGIIEKATITENDIEVILV
ncbi:P2 gpJ-like protein [Shewanella sp. phage 1/41]|uniref:P2 gpJ-like protein n=1 Tax=Shewanella sp. phage 1/41 TaxID=1458861 RepID=UPI0004F7B025|nr:P2 gpJ-like protein [Shewanella sp. phage 1/41]AHK11701.1 P2 gpJ-like protein [Shewanella sp. phage 1/41]